MAKAKQEKAEIAQEGVGIPFEDWVRIKTTFSGYGFSEAESEWAANNDLDPKGDKADQVIRLLKNRSKKVAVLMRYTGLRRKEVINSCDEMRRENAAKKGAEDIMNLFVGET